MKTIRKQDFEEDNFKLDEEKCECSPLARHLMEDIEIQLSLCVVLFDSQLLFMEL